MMKLTSSANAGMRRNSATRLCGYPPVTFFFAPRGTPHSIKCLGPETGRELMISSPGGVFDAFIDDVVSSMTASGSPIGAPAVDFRAIAGKYGIEFLS